MYDTLVVGAGPAGSLAAMLLGRKADVLVAEEHQTAGYPVQCAGLISDVCYEGYRKYCRIGRAVENEIDGAFFFSPSGRCIEAAGKAWVVERKILDQMLLEKASEVADVEVKSKVRFRNGRAYVGGREVKVERIVGADGIASSVAAEFGFKKPGLFLAVQAEMRFEPLDEHFVELYFGRRWSNFFAYSVPVGDTARIGVICSHDPLIYFKNLVEKHPSLSKRVKGGWVELNVGAIPSQLVEFVRENVALIGDAAGMVKPYTGGGLYYLLRAAEKLSDAFPNFQKYRDLYMKEFGKEHTFGSRIRRIYSMDDEDLEKLFTLMANFDFPGVHMDRPTTLMRLEPLVKIFCRLVRSPGMALKVVKTLI